MVENIRLELSEKAATWAGPCGESLFAIRLRFSSRGIVIQKQIIHGLLAEYTMPF